MACGLQNAMTTKFSGNMIRTSHATGALTDIGLTLGRMARGRKDSLWKLGLLVPMTLSFFIGGVLAAALFRPFGRQSLVLSILLYGGTAVVYTVYFSKYFNVSYYKAMFGNVEFFSNKDKQTDSYNFDAPLTYHASLEDGSVDRIVLRDTLFTTASNDRGTTISAFNNM